MKERTLNKLKAPEKYKGFTWCERSIRVNDSGFLLIKNYGNYEQLIYPVVKKITFDEMSVKLGLDDVNQMIRKICEMPDTAFKLFLNSFDLDEFYKELD